MEQKYPKKNNKAILDKGKNNTLKKTFWGRFMLFILLTLLSSNLGCVKVFFHV